MMGRDNDCDNARAVSMGVCRGLRVSRGNARALVALAGPFLGRMSAAERNGPSDNDRGYDAPSIALPRASATRRS